MIENPAFIVGLSAHSTGVYKKRALAVGMNNFSRIYFLTYLVMKPIESD